MTRFDDSEVGGRSVDVVQWEFIGDQDTAMHYIGRARVLIGELQYRMSFQGVKTATNRENIRTDPPGGYIQILITIGLIKAEIYIPLKEKGEIMDECQGFLVRCTQLSSFEDYHVIAYARKPKEKLPMFEAGEVIDNRWLSSDYTQLNKAAMTWKWRGDPWVPTITSPPYSGWYQVPVEFDDTDGFGRRPFFLNEKHTDLAINYEYTDFYELLPKTGPRICEPKTGAIAYGFGIYRIGPTGGADDGNTENMFEIKFPERQKSGSPQGLDPERGWHAYAINTDYIQGLMDDGIGVADYYQAKATHYMRTSGEGLIAMRANVFGDEKGRVFTMTDQSIDPEYPAWDDDFYPYSAIALRNKATYKPTRYWNFAQDDPYDYAGDTWVSWQWEKVGFNIYYDRFNRIINEMGYKVPYPVGDNYNITMDTMIPENMIGPPMGVMVFPINNGWDVGERKSVGSVDTVVQKGDYVVCIVATKPGRTGYQDAYEGKDKAHTVPLAGAEFEVEVILYGANYTPNRKFKGVTLRENDKITIKVGQPVIGKSIEDLWDKLVKVGNI